MFQSPYDDTQFKQRLTDDDLDELMIHVVRCPEILEGVTDLSPCDAKDWFLPVWKVVAELIEVEGAHLCREKNWRNRVEAATKIELRECVASLADWKTLFGPDAIVEGEVENEWDEEDLEDDNGDGDSDHEVDQHECDEYEDDEYDDDSDEEDSDDEEDVGDDEGFFERTFSANLEDLDPASARELLRLFLYERLVVVEIGQLIPNDEEEHLIRQDIAHVLTRVEELSRRIDGVTTSQIHTLSDDWDAHEEQLSVYRGKELIGLKTGIAELDRRTLGLRGLGALGSPPNLGKTALTLQMALGVCRYHKLNEAVAVYVSLDMPKKDLYSRIKCNLAEMEAVTLFQGSSGTADPKSYFNSKDQKRLRKAKRLMEKRQIGSRLLILDRHDLGDQFTTGRLLGIVDKLKSRAKASRALIVVDYLQILPVPMEEAYGNEHDQDRYRIRMMQDLVAQTKTDKNPDGDAVLFISEARKPPSSKDKWGASLSEFMGTARLTYAIDYALIYRRMEKGEEMLNYYGVNKDDADSHLKKLDRNGIAPSMLCLEKARDGMVKGQWGMEFHFKKSIFTELDIKPRCDDANCDDEDEDDIDPAFAKRVGNIDDIGIQPHSDHESS